MFERPHHRRIAKLLGALDGALLREHHCWFGGGTAIALSHNEYRESVDVDFLVSDLAGYRELRRLATSGDGINALARRELHILREVRADQYGIRTLIEIDGEAIKFEIIHEGRISLDDPGYEDQVCEVAALTAVDMAATKLLANADRGADRGVYSRDIIDLAMMELSPELFHAGVAKASEAYGDSILQSLNAAIEFLRDNPHRLDECQRALSMSGVPKAVLWQRIKRVGSL